MNLDKVCIDASVAVAWLFEEDHSSNADALRQLWYRADTEMVVPALFHAEVTSAIRKSVYLKGITKEEGEEAFSIYSSIPVRVVDGLEISRMAWHLSIQNHLPVCYDMYYLAVAELIRCYFWTNDKKLVNSLRGKNTLIKYLGDYHITKG